MNEIRIDNATNYRKPLGTLILVLAVLLICAAVLLLGPMRQHALGLNERESRVLRDLQGQPSPSDLLGTLREAENRHEAMAKAEQKWKTWVNTLGDKPSKFSGNSEEDLRIDYKVALFNSRARLQRQAGKQKVTLPADMGVPETIDEGEVAVLRLWQLEAVENVLSICINLGLPQVDSVEALPAISMHAATASPYPHHEFPVRLQVQAYPDQSIALLKALQEKGSFFAVRRFSAERKLSATGNAEPLDITLVVGAKLFQPLVTVATEGDPFEGLDL